MFLNITPTVTNWTADNNQFSLIFEENPLADFVELPDDGKAQDELWYSNVLCGILRGALEMVSGVLPIKHPGTSFSVRYSEFMCTSAHVQQVQMQVDVHYVSDVLRGNDTTEMRITLLRYIEDEMPPDDE